MSLPYFIILLCAGVTETCFENDLFCYLAVSFRLAHNDPGRAGWRLRSVLGSLIGLDAAAIPCLVPEQPAQCGARKTSLALEVGDSIFL